MTWTDTVINFATKKMEVWGAYFNVRTRHFMVPSEFDTEGIVYIHTYEYSSGQYIAFNGKGVERNGKMIYTIRVAYIECDEDNFPEYFDVHGFTLIFPEDDLYTRNHYLANELLYDFALASPLYHEDNRIDERKAYLEETIKELIEWTKRHHMIDTTSLTVKQSNQQHA